MDFVINVSHLIKIILDNFVDMKPDQSAITDRDMKASMLTFLLTLNHVIFVDGQRVVRDQLLNSFLNSLQKCGMYVNWY